MRCEQQGLSGVYMGCPRGIFMWDESLGTWAMGVYGGCPLWWHRLPALPGVGRLIQGHPPRALARCPGAAGSIRSVCLSFCLSDPSPHPCRTAPSAWSASRHPPATRGPSPPSNPTWWGSWRNVATSSTSTAWWPCTTTATRYEAAALGGPKSPNSKTPALWWANRGRGAHHSHVLR